VSCCDVYGNTVGDWIECIEGQDSVRGNFSADPLFCDTLSDDYHLRPYSPCLDASGCGFVGPLGEGSCVRSWYVATTGSDITGDGSLGNPFATIQRGIDHAMSSDSVVVRCGTYTENGIIMKSGICLRSETDSACCATINADSQGRAFYCSDVDSTCTLRGFTIMGGYDSNEGGGMYCKDSSPVISDCTFLDNSADNLGGGLYCNTSSPALDHCAFAGNAAWEAGAVCCDSSSAPSFRYCTFSGSEAGIYGSVLGIWNESSPNLTNCTIVDNAKLLGSVVVLCLSGSTPRLDNTIIAFNHAATFDCDGPGTAPELNCCDLYGNTVDWSDLCILFQNGVNGNFSANPLFCDLENHDFHLDEASPCAPFSPPDSTCDLIGAGPVACDAASVREDEQVVPITFSLELSIPAPFNPGANVEYSIARSCLVQIEVYDASGRSVRQLVECSQMAGEHRVKWHARDDTGRPVASGVYFCHLVADRESITRKMVLID
jgi:predicted outer membrane repeat protein